jgi:L-aminopeptidase/D-esterase-like protein
MMSNELSITLIPGIRVGHFTNEKCATGCTVILCENGGATCGVDIRGAAPGTRETALLAPTCLVEKVNAVLLTGGSALGLAAADGVMKYCQEQGYGFGMARQKIPIVPAAVIYDFNVGEQGAPTAEQGYQACLQASTNDVIEGNVGAGTGALVGKVCGIQHSMRGGLGTAVLSFPTGLKVGALVVVNTFGDVRSDDDHRIIAGARTKEGNGFLDTVKYLINGHAITTQSANTLIGVIATNATASKTQLTLVAQMAYTGVSQVITPAQTLYDGDTLFALGTGESDLKADINLIGIAAAEVVKKAIQRAIFKSVGREGLPAYSEI